MKTDQALNWPSKYLIDIMVEACIDDVISHLRPLDHCVPHVLH
jgi:hypothetical protein